MTSSPDISKAGEDGPGVAFGLVYGEVTAERVEASVPVEPPVQQPFGLVHGGVYSTIAESICSSATAIAVASEGKIAMGHVELRDLPSPDDRGNGPRGREPGATRAARPGSGTSTSPTTRAGSPQRCA